MGGLALLHGPSLLIRGLGLAVVGGSLVFSYNKLINEYPARARDIQEHRRIAERYRDRVAAWTMQTSAPTSSAGLDLTRPIECEVGIPDAILTKSTRA